MPQKKEGKQVETTSRETGRVAHMEEGATIVREKMKIEGTDGMKELDRRYRMKMMRGKKASLKKIIQNL